MIVVIGALELADAASGSSVAGLAGAIAVSAAAAGSAVQVIAKIGDDPAGDALLLALARGGVGHVATLRDASHPTAERPATMPADQDVDAGGEPDVVASSSPLGSEASPVDGVGPQPPILEPADVALALRYLPDYQVVVVVHPSATVLAEAVEAARWAGAHLVVMADPAGTLPDLPATALALAVASDDADGVGPLIGAYCAAVDGGAEPAAAFATTLGAAATA